MLFNPQIVYEDDFLTIINKPAGIVVNKSESVGNNETVQQWAEQYLNIHINYRDLKKENNQFLLRGGIVHRLDKDTSGILILAKNELVFDKMQDLFKKHEVKKKYIALVHGVTNKEGSIAGGISRHPKKGKFIVDREKGKYSLTEYTYLRQYIFNKTILNSFEIKNYVRLSGKYDIDNYSLLEIYLYTGRTHQIRVHFAHIGHPIAGDKLYGYKKIVNFEQIWCPRQFLHASEINFVHPIKNNLIKLKIDLADDLLEITKKYLISI